MQNVSGTKIHTQAQDPLNSIIDKDHTTNPTTRPWKEPACKNKLLQQATKMDSLSCLHSLLAAQILFHFATVPATETIHVATNLPPKGTSSLKILPRRFKASKRMEDWKDNGLLLLLARGVLASPPSSRATTASLLDPTRLPNRAATVILNTRAISGDKRRTTAIDFPLIEVFPITLQFNNLLYAFSSGKP